MAAAAAITGDAIQCAAVAPIKAAARLPPMIDHGCVGKLAGAPNSSTAEAPIGAISKGRSQPGPNHAVLIKPVRAMPRKAPKLTRSASCQL